jgi:hypothetical protein
MCLSKPFILVAPLFFMGLQIRISATPFLSHSYKTPGVLGRIARRTLVALLV